MLAFFHAESGDVTTYQEVEQMTDVIVVKHKGAHISLTGFYRQAKASEAMQYDVNYLLHRFLELPQVVVSNGFVSNFTKGVNFDQNGFDAGEFFARHKHLFADAANFYSINEIDIKWVEETSEYRMMVWFDTYPLDIPQNRGLLQKIERYSTINEALSYL